MSKGKTLPGRNRDDEMNFDMTQWYMQTRREEEYRDYKAMTPMSKRERKALRNWVRTGHSVYEVPGSRYLPDSSSPRAFLDVYREDAFLDQATQAMNEDQKRKYLMEYLGWEEETREEKEKRIAKENTPDMVREHVCKQNRKLFYLWEFLAGEGLCQEAREYLDEHMADPIPFEFEI